MDGKDESWEDTIFAVREFSLWLWALDMVDMRTRSVSISFLLESVLGPVHSP